MIKNWFFILYIGFCINSFGQNNISLQESIQYGIKNHPSIYIANNNISIAKEKSTQSVALYLPQINSSANFTDNIQLQTTVIPANSFTPVPVEIQLGTKYNTNAGIDFTQTIFDQTKLSGIKANKPYIQLTELQKQQNQESIIYNTAVAYFQLLTYQEQLKNLYENKKNYEELVTILENQLKNGVVLEKDVDRVKVSLNSTNYQIEDTKTKEQLALNNFKNAMGMPLENPIMVQNTLNYELFATIENTENLELTNLTEVKINETSIVLEEINVKTKQGSYFPTITAFGKLGTQALNSNFDDAFTNWNGYSYIGISANFMLFNGFKRKSILQEEKLNLKNDKINLEISKENLKLQFENAKTSMITSYSSFKSNKENMELAKKVVEVTDYQYKKGVANLSDFLNDDSAYKNAQTNYINSLYNLMISQLNYHKSKGNLLPFLNQIN